MEICLRLYISLISMKSVLKAILVACMDDRKLQTFKTKSHQTFFNFDIFGNSQLVLLNDHCSK